MGHFYTAEGICIDGLRAARKMTPLPLPSPTTVLSMIKGEGLIQYFKRCMWEAAVTTPRQPHWDDDAHYEACVRWAEEHGQAARDKGGEFHDMVQRFHGGLPVPLGEQTMMAAYADWYDRYVEKTIGNELVVIGEGYAGRLDHLCLLKDGRIAITDTKSQDITKRRTFNHYPEWALQLGAYAGAVNRFPGLEGPLNRHSDDNVDVLVSICISSKPPFVVEAFYWPKPIDYYANLFMGMLALWKEVHDYWP